MERIERLRSWLESHRPFVFEALRIYLGLSLTVLGVAFARNPSGVSEFLTGSSWRLSGELFIGHYVALVHLVGGAMLAVGLLTRLAAAVQVPALIGAVLFVNRPDVALGSPSQGHALLVLVLLVLMTIHGGGPWSVDAALARSWRSHRPQLS